MINHSRPVALFPRNLSVAGVLLCALGGATVSPSQSPVQGGELPPVAVTSPRVANQSPAGTFSMAVSGLRFEPRVDVQARNLAEAQADVSIRGGHFENTGIRLGAVSLVDPQTGHYLTELPISPEMLNLTGVHTGARNAIEGFNAGAGTVAFGWRPIERRGRIALGVGEHGFNAQTFYQGAVAESSATRASVGADLAWARSQSDGSRPFGDHDFEQISGRIQRRNETSQTDLAGGYQSKFFGWPNLYTPFGFNETENLQTTLVTFNHRARYGADSWLEAGAYYRRNKDDYEFNRAVPGASNPFQHTTRISGASVGGRHQSGEAAVDYSAAWMSDRLRSTALTFGRYRSRSQLKLAAVPELAMRSGGTEVVVRAGAVVDESNREGSKVSPVIGVARRSTDGKWRYYAEYSGAAQTTSYTALNSNPNAGLFRGNPDLGWETSRNLEVGAEFTAGEWRIEGSVFHRQDDDLVDWTFRRNVTARSANPVDIGTLGIEVIAIRRVGSLDAVFGYAWLEKDADYRQVAIDGSFYALNFARHRVTAAVTWRPGGGWSVCADNEFRSQEPNPLRTSGTSALLSELSIGYIPPRYPQLEFTIQVGNLWDSDFEEVPSVPAGRRQGSFTAAWRW